MTVFLVSKIGENYCFQNYKYNFGLKNITTDSIRGAVLNVIYCSTKIWTTYAIVMSALDSIQHKYEPSNENEINRQIVKLCPYLSKKWY